MGNDVSLTVRLPKDLNSELTNLSKKLGITKVNLLRFAVHYFLQDKPTTLTFDTSIVEDEKFRFAFNVNRTAYELLNSASEEYGQSINSVVTSIAFLALKHYSRYL